MTTLTTTTAMAHLQYRPLTADDHLLNWFEDRILAGMCEHERRVYVAQLEELLDDCTTAAHDRGMEDGKAWRADMEKQIVEVI